MQADDEVNIYFCLFGSESMQHLFCVNYPSNNVSQASLVKQTLVADSALADLQVATVDAYEGTEKDIIIL